MVTVLSPRDLAAVPELLAAVVPGDLRIATELRAVWPADLVAAATEQVALRARASARLRDADTMLLTSAGLEQASATVVAAHRAARIAASVSSVADLCCGIGSDLRELVAAGVHAVGVDRDETHAWCARHNSGAAVAVADVRDVRLGGVEAVYVDPARRSGDRRGGYQPPLDWCQSLPVARVAVKAAPGLDLNVVAEGWEVEFVAEGRDLKEACLWSPAWATASRRATVLPSGDSLVADPAAPRPAVRAPGRYVVDPSPAVTRAGAVADLAAIIGAWQIDKRIAFLCLDEPTATPYGRVLEVVASL
ncbi:MAG: class I SAM-dependent methyltransferase, partial [Frankiales bacterium]|nr:class I SAM-dependent methyltransferase [Frankiales bacterium]